MELIIAWNDERGPIAPSYSIHDSTLPDILLKKIQDEPDDHYEPYELQHLCFPLSTCCSHSKDLLPLYSFAVVLLFPSNGV